VYSTLRWSLKLLERETKEVPLDFRRGQHPPNFLARAMQLRLLLLVLALGLVILLALEARKPQYYRWLIPPDERERATAPPHAPRPADRPICGEVSTEQRSISPEQLDQHDALAGKVRDDRKVVPSEWDAWLALFDILNRAGARQIEAASLGPVTYVQLFDESDHYRGRLVTVGGRVRRAHRANLPRNQYGLTSYYQLWVQPDDHPRDPIVIWCLQLPEGFPTGMQIDQGARVTGFYFKRMTYLAADSHWRRAPLLLARSIGWQPAPAVAASSSKSADPWVVIAAGLGIAVVATMLVYLRTRGRGPATGQAPPLRDHAGRSFTGGTFRAWAENNHTGSSGHDTSLEQP